MVRIEVPAEIAKKIIGKKTLTKNISTRISALVDYLVGLDNDINTAIRRERAPRSVRQNVYRAKRELETAIRTLGRR